MKKLLLLITLFVSVNYAKELTLEDVRTLFPFGKTESEIENTIKELKNNNISVKDAINGKFDQNEKEILLNLQKSFPKLSLNFDELKNCVQNYYTQNLLFTTKPTIINKTDDHPLVMRSREIIASLGMNPEHMIIAGLTKEQQKDPTYKAFLGEKILFAVSICFYNAKDNNYFNCILFDLELCQTLKAFEFDAVIAHECMHLWYADQIKKRYLNKEIKKFCELSGIKNKSDLDRIESFKSLIQNNRELRADIMAALHDEEYRIGFYSLWSMFALLDLVVPCVDQNHPSSQQRVDAIKQLNIYLEKEQNT